MSTTLVPPNQDALVTEIDIAVPAERVFQALTDPAQLGRWFGDVSCPVKFWEMDARMGGSYGYETEESSTVAINGVNQFKCHGEILEFNPPRLLVYTWIANWHDDKQRKTVVRWDLTPISSGTHVKVTHSGLGEEKVAREDYRAGWPGVLENLKRFTETRKD